MRHGLFEVPKCNLGYVISYLLQKHLPNKRKGRPQCYFFYLIVNSIVLLLRKLQILVRYILYPTVPYIFQAVRLYSIYLLHYLLRTTSSFKHIHFYLYYKSGKVSQRISRTIHFWWLQTLPKPFNKNGEEESKERTFQVISLKRISKNALLSRRDLPCCLDKIQGRWRKPKSKLLKHLHLHMRVPISNQYTSNVKVR